MSALHQQQGGMSLRAFAEQTGFSERYILNCARSGRIVGARQDSRSKKWTIYPPAKLVDKSGDCVKPREKLASGFDFGTSPHGLSADRPNPGQEILEVPSCRLPAKPVLTSPDAALPVAARTKEHGTPASCGNVYRCPETQSALRAIREAAARQCREGIHYLRLQGREFAQLYAALDHERSRIRKLVGKGLVDVGNLRASDSVWQKMQAMCQQGSLL